MKANLVALAKAAILFTWIGGLVGLSLLSVSGRASNMLLDAARAVGKGRTYSFAFDGNCPGADNTLVMYQMAREHPPPVRAVLDAIAPTWREVYDCTNTAAGGKYTELFRRIENQLSEMADGDALLDPSKTYALQSDLLPKELFPGDKGSRLLEVPESARAWIDAERARRGDRARQYKLVDTFVLLAVIGAFGSLTYLIRGYLEDKGELPIRNYAFRPVFGIFMAMGMFAIAALAHALVSKASILEIRHEPLYILALAAGLLSERAYGALEARLGRAIEVYKKSGGVR
jgi:hypothetical protein